MPDIKLLNWKDIDLSLWKEGSVFGPTDPLTNKPALRASVAGGKVASRLDGFVDLIIDYTNPLCPYRIECTENPWMIRLVRGTEDIYTFVYRFPSNYKKEHVVTPKSLLQFYCKSTSPEFGAVLFQLELSGGVNPKFPQGSIQVINNHPLNKSRVATSFIPKADEDIRVVVKMKHGLAGEGHISCTINSQSVYNLASPTLFVDSPTATAQFKLGIYDHMLNNEGDRVGIGEANRQKHLAVGAKEFRIALSPIIIARRKPDEVFGAWIDALCDPLRVYSHDYPNAFLSLNKLYDQLTTSYNAKEAQVLSLQASLTQTNSLLSATEENNRLLKELAAEQKAVISDQSTTINNTLNQLRVINEKVGELNILSEPPVNPPVSQ
jgi:hypothetical protein